MGEQEHTYTVRVICERFIDGFGDVLMVNNLTRGLKPAGWGLPGGGRGEEDVSLESAAVREVNEKTGIEISIEDLIEIDRSLARDSTTHFNCTFGVVAHHPSMGEPTIKNDPRKTVYDAAWISYEDIMAALSSWRNGGLPMDLWGKRYYPSHLAIICGSKD